MASFLGGWPQSLAWLAFLTGGPVAALCSRPQVRGWSGDWPHTGAAAGLVHSARPVRTRRSRDAERLLPPRNLCSLEPPSARAHLASPAGPPGAGMQSLSLRGS